KLDLIRVVTRQDKFLQGINDNELTVGYALYPEHGLVQAVRVAWAIRIDQVRWAQCNEDIGCAAQFLQGVAAIGMVIDVQRIGVDVVLVWKCRRSPEVLIWRYVRTREMGPNTL